MFFRSSLYSYYSCKRHSENETLAGKLTEIKYLIYTNTFVQCHTYIHIYLTDTKEKKRKETNDGNRNNN